MKPIVNKVPPEPISEGPHPSVIAAVGERGMMHNFNRTKLIYTLAIGFELINERSEGVRRMIWKSVNGESLHEKSSLGKILASLGIVVKPGVSFDPASLIGKNLTLLIRHTTKGDRTFADIDGFAKLPAGVTPVAPEHQPDEPMPSWLQPQPPVNGPAKNW